MKNIQVALFHVTKGNGDFTAC